MKKTLAIVLLCFLCSSLQAQCERLVRTSIGGEAIDGSNDYLQLTPKAWIFLMEGGLDKKEFIFVKGKIPYRFVTEQGIIQDAPIYQFSDTPVGKIVKSYFGNLKIRINDGDSLVEMGFYVYVNSKDFDQQHVLERAFERYMDLKPSKKQKAWEFISQEYGFWGAQIWKEKYYIHICYDEYTFDDYYSDYRLMVLFNSKDSMPVAYVHKDKKINVPFVESKELKSKLTIKYLVALEPEERETLEELLNDYYIK